LPSIINKVDIYLLFAMQNNSDQPITDFTKITDQQSLHPESPGILRNETRKKKKKKKQLSEKVNVILNVSDTQYPVVRYVGKKMLKWKL